MNVASITVQVTVHQMKALDEAIAKQEFELSRAALARALLKKFVQDHGVEWPDKTSGEGSE